MVGGAPARVRGRDRPVSDASEARLRALSARIERLSIEPAEIARSSVWLRATRPFYRLIKWRAQIRTEALRALLARLRAAGGAEKAAGQAPEKSVDEAAATSLASAVEAAIEELEANVAAAERAAVLDERAAHGPFAGWLARLHEVTSRAVRAAESPADEARRAAAIDVDGEWMLRPLTVTRGATTQGDAARSGGALSQEKKDDPSAAAGDKSAPAREVDAAGAEDGGGEDDPRLVEIELAAIDRVLDAARAETAFLGRRRRLFDAARKLLLDASAALPLDPLAVSSRAQHIADQIVLANRWEAAGVSPEIALPYQMVTALARGERERLYASLSAAFTAASGDGDVAMAARTKEALRRMDGGSTGAAREASTERSASELLGDVTVGAVRDAYEAARRELSLHRTSSVLEDDPIEQEQRTERWSKYLHEEAVLATLSAAISVDGCFEVGGTLAPVRVHEESRRVRVVDHPTQDLVLVTSSDATDLPSAIIDDPRGVILALAEGRLLARKYRKIETIRTTRTRLTGEARVYVLDGSDSMLMGASGRAAGARARMRDALLLAELATLFRRTTEGARDARVVLFYRYFTKALGDVTRVATPAEATRAMAEVVGTPRHGGTNIEAALLASFDQIREARAIDPDLARAQIVLVTDGEAPVDEAAVIAAREREGDFPIGVSVVALGEENPVLRRLVARQRARGEPAFYHFVSDAELGAIVSGERASSVPIHMPAVADLEGASAALSRELGGIIDEIDTLDRRRSEQGHARATSEAMGTADADSLALAGLPSTETEGERARREARARDERALALRFDAWFPASNSMEAKAGEASTEDVEAALIVLSALAEVLNDLLGTPAERQADAIEILERLLPDARLSPARYRSVVASRPPSIARAIDAVRRIAEGAATRTSRSPSR